jgi:hypothetical protein
VPFVAGEGAGFGQRLHRGVRDGEPGGIGAGVEFGVDAQSGAGVVVAAMVCTMTSWLVSGRPRQFIEMWENRRCSTLFHLLVPGGRWRVDSSEMRA